jgi:hypothetical protein
MKIEADASEQRILVLFAAFAYFRALRVALLMRFVQDDADFEKALPPDTAPITYDRIQRAGDADPGSLERRRREIALRIYITMWV